MASTENDTNATAPENPLASAPQSIQWTQTLELGYDEPETPIRICFSCGKPQQQDDAETKADLSKCAKCQVAVYCSRECQVKDWKEGRHKFACPSYTRSLTCMDTDETKEQIRNEIFARIRFYACPYAVFKTAELGNGFLFIQSDTTLKDLSIAIPKDSNGRTLTRSIIMHFLTMGEYDAEVCKDDFEMAVVRSNLQELMDNYDEQKEVVLLLRFRCGHVALGKAVLVPDYGICKKLGQDYYADNPAGAVQLTLDDL
jgi:hypothetical protein